MVLNHAWRSLRRPIDAWWSNTIARAVTFFGLTVILVTHRAPSMEVALAVWRGMINLPQTWHDPLGPLGLGLGWLGFRFDGPPVADGQIELVLWLIVWLSVVWFLPNTQQLLARWHPAYNYGVAERQRDLPLIERTPSLTRLLPWRLEWRPNAAAAVFVGLLAALAFLNLHHVSEFLYFRY
jgi:alginate O-acetyltransferase complex protein AlgI